jgi:hypothetical protein
MWTSAARPCRSLCCDPPPTSYLRSVELRPLGRLEARNDGRMLVSAMPWRCFPVVRRQLQHPRPTVDQSVPPFAKKYFADAALASLSGEEVRVFNREKYIGLAERKISVLVCGYFDFQNPPYITSRQLLIPRIADAGTSFVPLPCQAKHG